jgi:hypothetical protein
MKSLLRGLSIQNPAIRRHSIKSFVYFIHAVQTNAKKPMMQQVIDNLQTLCKGADFVEKDLQQSQLILSESSVLDFQRGFLEFLWTIFSYHCNKSLKLSKLWLSQKNMSWILNIITTQLNGEESKPLLGAISIECLDMAVKFAVQFFGIGFWRAFQVDHSAESITFKQSLFLGVSNQITDSAKQKDVNVMIIIPCLKLLGRLIRLEPEILAFEASKKKLSECLELLLEIPGGEVKGATSLLYSQFAISVATLFMSKQRGTVDFNDHTYDLAGEHTLLKMDVAFATLNDGMALNDARGRKMAIKGIRKILKFTFDCHHLHQLPMKDQAVYLLATVLDCLRQGQSPTDFDLIKGVNLGYVCIS